MNLNCLVNLKEALEAEITRHMTPVSRMRGGKKSARVHKTFKIPRSSSSNLPAVGERQCVARLGAVATGQGRDRGAVGGGSSANHTPTEAEFAQFEAEDRFVQLCVAALDALLAPFRCRLTEHNYQVR